MVQLRPIVLTLGLVLCAIAATMVLPAIVDIADNEPGWRVFLASAVFTFFIGGLMLLVAYNDQPMQLGIKEGFVLTTFIWVFVAAFAAIPFVGQGLPYTDAFFESMSGLTTTGATVLVPLDTLLRLAVAALPSRFGLDRSRRSPGSKSLFPDWSSSCSANCPSGWAWP